MITDKFLKCLYLLLLSVFFIPFTHAQELDLAKATHDEPALSLQKFEENIDIDIDFVADSLIDFAQNYLKRPYRLGASGEKSFDCSGFSSFVYSKFGYSLNRTAQGQANENGIEIPRDSLKKGDLVFFKGRNAKKNRVGHVGIVYEVLPNGSFTFIHASCKYGVTITEGDKAYYNTRFVKARRVLDENVIDNFKTIYPLKQRKEESLLF